MEHSNFVKLVLAQLRNLILEVVQLKDLPHPLGDYFVAPSCFELIVVQDIAIK